MLGVLFAEEVVAGGCNVGYAFIKAAWGLKGKENQAGHACHVSVKLMFCLELRGYLGYDRYRRTEQG